MPERAAVCGLPPPLSATETVAVRVPVAVGVKVTLIVQLLFPEIPVPQVLVSEKSPALVPLMVMLVIFNAFLETSERVID